MENKDAPEVRKISRREALGIFGTAAGASVLAACAGGAAGAAQPNPAAATTATSTPTALATVTPTVTTAATTSSSPPVGITSATTSFERYYQEWLSLRDVLHGLDARYSSVSPLPRRQTIVYIIRALEQFGDGQFNLFYNGFNRSGPAASVYPELEPSVDFGPQEVLATTIAQISKDITTIQQVAEQRLWTFSVGAGSNTVAVGDFLQKMDSLAASGLWPGQWVPFPTTSSPPNSIPTWFNVLREPQKDQGPLLDGSETYDGDFQIKTALTYFSAEVDVRVIPYARVALIGIPYGSLYHPQDLLALPHEIGHFLYWYSQPNMLVGPPGYYVNAREVSGKWQTSGAAGLENWREEIFADIYAALRGGPIAILATMDQAMEHSRAEFSDMSMQEKHPTPKLRPFILVKALANFSGELSSVPKTRVDDPTNNREEIAEELWTAWETRLKNERGISLPDTDINSMFSPGLGLDPSMPLEEMILQLLGALRQAIGIVQLGWGWTNPYDVRAAGFPSTALNDILRSNGEFDLFKRDLQYFEIDEELLWLPEFNHSTSTIPPLWRSWVESAKQYFALTTLGLSTPVPAGTFPDDMDPTKNPFPIDRWIRVYGSGGWTTEGPCTTRV